MEEDKSPLVLVVDDSLTIRVTIGGWLSEQGFRVTLAEDGLDALNKIEAQPPDLILLDFMMPKMNGAELCQQLKKDELTSDIPIIFLTSLSKPEHIAEGFESGAVDYVVKPCNHAELLSRVITHLELKSSREELIKKNAEQNEMLHVLCHDLVNPFFAIHSFMKISKNKPIEWLIERRDRLEQIAQHGINVIELIRQMRSTEESDAPLQLVSVNLKNAVEESYLILQQRFQEKQIELVQHIDEDLFIRAEKISLINSVFNNLLTNAIKFSFRDSKVEIKSQILGDYIKLTVKDYGIGISEALLENLFNPKKIMRTTGTEGERGTGYGMLLVLRFMKSYGGDIKISSRQVSERGKSSGTSIHLMFAKA